MFGDSRLAHPQLARNEQAANPVLDQISVPLRRKVLPGILQPLQNLQPSVVSERLNGVRKCHLVD